jgi:hypothetical protein
MLHHHCGGKLGGAAAAGMGNTLGPGPAGKQAGDAKGIGDFKYDRRRKRKIYKRKWIRRQVPIEYETDIV